MRIVLALLLLCAGLAAAPPVASAGRGWDVRPSPFQLDLGKTGQRESGFRTADGTEHRLTDLVSQHRVPHGFKYVVATSDPGRVADVVVTRTPRGLRVGTTFRPDTGVAQVFTSLPGSLDEHYLGGGAHTMFVDLRGKVLLNKAVFVGASTFGKCNKNGAPSTFFISSAGYGVYADTKAIGRTAFPGAVEDNHCNDKPAPCPVKYGVPDRIQLCFKTGRIDYEVYSGSPAQVNSAYFKRVGLPTLPPPRQLALTKWRDKYNHSDEIVEDVTQFQQRGVPLDTLWVDNPWEQGPVGARPTYACIGALKFDKTMYPDAQGTIDWMRSRGVNLGVWVAPFLSKMSDGKECPHDYPAGSFVQSDRTNVWDIDLTNPVARAHYEAKLEAVFRMGVNMVKGDRGEEHNFEESTFQGGPGTLIHNQYPLLYAESVVRMLRKVHGDNYTTLFRAGGDGMPTQLRGFWQADADMSFDGLRLSVRRGINSWISGHPVQGSDTGGYRNLGGGPSESLFVRWSQMSAVSPVFQVGSSGRNSTPWVYDPATFERFRRAAVLHYELFPYLYRAARQASRDGTPITQPMAFQYPSDAEAWKADQQFMVGPDLLAAPVTADRAEADGAAGQPTPVDVYLPPGKWVDLFAGTVVEGGRHVTRLSTLDEFPLYLRAGSVAPLNFRTPDVWAKPWGVNDLDRTDRAGWVVSPDATGTFSALRTARFGDHLVVMLHGAPDESQLLIPANVKRVLIDGKPLPSSSIEQLRGQDTGWTTHSAPGSFGGTVLKLKPRHGHSTVLLTLT
ncbi:TIM-barrel domain-containing protein [Lentzea sp. NBRC 105346]|uniref:TIM-barrel domain-containing protein n=1 Tax=Lentzea sp. NBRC 105346 TaxID=3032205 RepID=UPI002554B18B|nr:TIM-barrel domain-containing protein [Lentzea sp. NBRC 105346]